MWYIWWKLFNLSLLSLLLLYKHRIPPESNLLIPVSAGQVDEKDEDDDNQIDHDDDSPDGEEERIVILHGYRVDGVRKTLVDLIQVQVHHEMQLFGPKENRKKCRTRGVHNEEWQNQHALSILEKFDDGDIFWPLVEEKIKNKEKRLN